MTYADFTLDTVPKILGVTLRRATLFENVVPVEVSPWLKEALGMASQVPLLNEKTRSEFVVAPIMLECRRLSGDKFTIFSGERLNVDPNKGLMGECDFILGLSPPLPVVQAPSAVILEAKRDDIEAALGQCAAQMVGAHTFNVKEGRHGVPIFGCVTTGERWQFLRLEETTLTMDANSYFITHLELILGVFQAIFVHYRPSRRQPEPPVW